MKNDIYILKICQQIEQIVGRKINNFSEVNWLEAEFQNKGIYISTNTLARLFGLLPKPKNTYTATLDNLARFLDYPNWANFVEIQEQRRINHNYFLNEDPNGFSEKLLEIALQSHDYEKVFFLLQKYTPELLAIHFSVANLIGESVRKSNYNKQLLQTLASIKQGRALFYETFVDENNENNNFSEALIEYYLPKENSIPSKFYVCCFILAQNLYNKKPSNEAISEFYLLSDKINFKEAYFHHASRWFEIRFLLLFTKFNEVPTSEFEDLVKEWLSFIILFNKNEWIIARSLKAIIHLGLKKYLIRNNEFNAIISQVLLKKRTTKLSAALFIIQLYWIYSNDNLKGNYEPIQLDSEYIQGNSKEYQIIETAITYLFSKKQEKVYLKNHLLKSTPEKYSWILKLLFD